MNLLKEYTPHELAQLTYKELKKRKKKRKDDYCGHSAINITKNLRRKKRG